MTTLARGVRKSAHFREHVGCTRAVDDLREPRPPSQLEGKVEALEWELKDLRDAVGAAKARRFSGLEALFLREPLTLRTHDDAGVLARLDERSRLRRQLEHLVADRARALGLPSAKPSRLAHWLATEPVRYEHHRIAPKVLFALPGLVALCCMPAFMGWRISGSLVGGLFGAVGLPLVAMQLRALWSDVVLTPHRLVLNREVFSLGEVQRIVAHVPFFGSRRQHVDVEVFFADSPCKQRRLSEFPRALKNELRMLKVSLEEKVRWF